VRALVLSGGGALGAFQVGALDHILGELETHYDIVTGISVGALNGSFISMYKPGEEKQSIIDLGKVWDTVNKDRIYKKNYHMGEKVSMALSAVSELSLYDSSPLVNLVRSSLDKSRIASSGKKLAVGAVSLATGEARYWDEDSTDIVEAVCASSSYPMFFAPVTIEKQLWTDGGIRNFIPMEKAISMGAKQLDVIITSPIDRTYSYKNTNTISSLLNMISILLDEVSDTDYILGSLFADYDNIPVKLLCPEVHLKGNGLNFSQENVKLNRAIGYEASKSMSWNY
jgi:NTE family protein